jgi:nucleoside-diphosphate-sugar epimerase
MKLLVTGATGFIGEHYIRHLHATRPDIKLFFSGRNLEKGSRLARETGAHYYRGDLADVPYVKLICKDIDVIVHCAGRSGLWGPYSDYYASNVIATEQLLEAAVHTGVGRLVNIGSPSVYFDFNDHLNVSEDFLPARFVDNYARTKYQAEVRVLRAHSEQLKTVSLRPRFVIGPGDGSIFPRLIASHQLGKLMQIGEGRNIVSMTSIENLMYGLDRAVFSSDDVTGDVYNLADPQPVNLWDTINQLLQAIDMPVVSRKVPYPIAFSIASVSESWHRIKRSKLEPELLRYKVSVMGNSFTLNLEKANRKLGYQPTQQIDSTVEAFADWWKQSGSRIQHSP